MLPKTLRFHGITYTRFDRDYPRSRAFNKAKRLRDAGCLARVEIDKQGRFWIYYVPKY